MTKEFAMLNASRRLENYLSREYFNLERMLGNDRISQSLFETKVGQYNELVDTLNDLFIALTGTNSLLFKRYHLAYAESDIAVVLPTYTTPHDRDEQVVLLEGQGVGQTSGEGQAVLMPEVTDKLVLAHAMLRVAATHETSAPVPIESSTPVESNTEADSETAVSDMQAWQAEGYNSYDEWLADKAGESTELHNDLTVGINTYLSQHRAGEVLSEYQQTSEHDIATYSPEDDVPVNVLPSEQPKRPTEDLRYLNHTADGTRVDGDPVQIAEVETAVERDYENSRKSADINVSSFLYQSDSMVVGNLIDDEISKLLMDQKPE